MPSAKNKKETRTGRKRIGDAFVDSRLITREQLREAIKHQGRTGGHLGSILIELGFITLDDLLDFLSLQSGVPGINLFTVDIDKPILEKVPLETVFNAKVLPVSMDRNSLTLAMVNPHDFETISEVGFATGRKVHPVIVPAFMMEAARRSLLTAPSGGISGRLIERMAAGAQDMSAGLPPLMALLQHMIKNKASDMLLTAGVPPSLKISHEIKRLSLMPLTPDACEIYARELLSEDEWKQFSEKNDIGLAVTYPHVGRFRVSVFRQRGSIALAIRHFPEGIPSFAALNLPDWLKTYALKPMGLILIGGPAGHGKSTTLCALVDTINTQRKCNIVTLEDPVEFLHQHKMSNVNQRQVGRDTISFQEGLRSVFRQAPDVIVIGEMRDRETYAIALKAANTGHLVLSTIHAGDTTSMIESLINTFEPYRQALVRSMLADSLILCLSQRLVPAREGERRVLALEKLINSHRIKNRIREEKTHHIRSQMQVGSQDFMSLDVALANLYKQGAIDLKTGRRYAEDGAFFSELASGGA